MSFRMHNVTDRTDKPGGGDYMVWLESIPTITEENTAVVLPRGRANRFPPRLRRNSPPVKSKAMNPHNLANSGRETSDRISISRWQPTILIAEDSADAREV